MTGLVRKATLFTACGVLVAAAAMAGVPSPGNSTLPSPPCLTVVGSSLGVPDSLVGKFCVVVKDLANNPINGSSVVIDFSACSDVKICSDQLNVNYTVNCVNKTVRAFTNASGTVCFTIIGGSCNVGGSAGAGAGCVKVFADGVQLGTLTAAVVDQDGASGVGANDLSAWIADFGTLLYFGRSDYDCDGSLGANDLSLWIGDFGALGSTESCVTYCASICP